MSCTLIPAGVSTPEYPLPTLAPAHYDLGAFVFGLVLLVYALVEIWRGNRS